jgi:hypothetical protein
MYFTLLNHYAEGRIKVEKSQALSDRKTKLDEKSTKSYGVITVQGSGPFSL